jgi:SAM-dependent methyltransferase
MAYAEYWRPQSLQEAMFQADVVNTDPHAYDSWGARWADTLHCYLPHPTRVIVDYGCGTGRVLRHMVGTATTGKPRKAKRLVGVDISEQMLSYIVDSDGIETHVGDGRSIPVGDEEADFVYSLLVLQHMDADDVLSVVQDTHRVLRSGGRCFHLFSAFGLAYRPGQTLGRGPCVWTGDASTSSHGAHGAIAYREADVRAIALQCGIEVISILHYNDDPNLAYYALVGGKR